MRKKKVLYIIAIIGLFALGSINPIFRLVKSIQFSQNCSGYLEQAADANTPELALERLNIAIDYIEKNNLTEGYTSVLVKKEDDNIGYWYRNLKACQKQLESSIGKPNIETYAIFLKLRDNIIPPKGIELYPHNLLHAILLLLTIVLLMSAFFVGLAYVTMEDD